MIDVVINGRFLTQAITGVQRYAREMTCALDERLSADAALRRQCRFVIVAPTGADDLGLTHIGLRIHGPLHGHAWEQLALPAAARGRLLLSLCNSGPLSVANQIVVLHDVAVFDVPDSFSFRFGVVSRAMRRIVCRRARRIVTVSSFSRARLEHWCALKHPPVVIPPSAEHVADIRADPTTLDRFGLRRGSYVLVVGGTSRRKNVADVVDAVGQLADHGLRVVITGESNPTVFGDHPTGGASFVGHVTDEQLRSLYENAVCLAYASSYEGFGIPPLEAMTLGCPVVAAAAPPLPEVCGDAALYFPPHDSGALAQAIRSLLDDGTRPSAMVAAGKAQSARYSWRRSAEALLALVAEVHERA